MAGLGPDCIPWLHERDVAVLGSDAISDVLPREDALERIRSAIRETYGKKGDAVVQPNLRAVDETLDRIHRVAVPSRPTRPCRIRSAPCP